MTNRANRARIAEETLAIIANGQYQHDGRMVDIADAVTATRANTRLYLAETMPVPIPAETFATRIEVTNETTFAAARRLHDAGKTVCALNFASAKNPGGGFLGGSQAQEESLARASALYAAIEPQRDYYCAGRASENALYTDHLIYSPAVPVFRDDEDQLLPQPWPCSIITAPAVNAGALLRNDPQLRGQIAPTMRRRIANMLAVALQHDHQVLVLGAWGCGVFRNDPADVAAWFDEALSTEPFAGAFEHIVFAVLDRADPPATWRAFATQFAPAAERS